MLQEIFFAIIRFSKDAEIWEVQMTETVRLTMGQALVRYLCNQFTEIDGERVPL